MTTVFFAITRAIHIGACLLLFGLFAFDRFVAAPIWPGGHTDAAKFWRVQVRWWSLWLLPVILLSGVAWFVLVAMTMSGDSLGETFQSDAMRTVWSQTRFGIVWQMRGVLWLACVSVIAAQRFGAGIKSLTPARIWLELFLSGLLLGSLTWAGHGQEGQPAGFHAGADVLHLLVAGCWPTGLLPLALLLREYASRDKIDRHKETATLVNRFSAMSLIAVSLLAATGFVNSWFLVGSFNNLIEKPYGRWLLAKIILFLLTVAIGAVNLLRLKPVLAVKSVEGADIQPALVNLKRNIRIELLLGIIITLVVGILGILPPATN